MKSFWANFIDIWGFFSGHTERIQNSRFRDGSIRKKFKGTFYLNLKIKNRNFESSTHKTSNLKNNLNKITIPRKLRKTSWFRFDTA